MIFRWNSKLPWRASNLKMPYFVYSKTFSRPGRTGHKNGMFVPWSSYLRLQTYGRELQCYIEHKIDEENEKFHPQPWNSPSRPKFEHISVSIDNLFEIPFPRSVMPNSYHCFYANEYKVKEYRRWTFFKPPASCLSKMQCLLAILSALEFLRLDIVMSLRMRSIPR